MYQDLQINRLRSLVTVVETGGFRRAAEELCVTQPAVSQQIQHLSRFIKGPVFLTTGRDLTLSPAGEELLAYARRMIALNDEIVERFSAPQNQGRTVTIGVADQLRESMPELLRQMSAALPHTAVTVRTGNGYALHQEIGTGRIDMALLLNQPAPATVREVHHMGNLKLGWFGRPMTRGELPLALFTEPCPFRGEIVEAFDSAKKPWRIGYECSDLPSLHAGVKAGLGVACLLANGADLWSVPTSDGLELPTPPASAPLTMAVALKGPAGPTLRIVREAVRRSLADYPFDAEGDRDGNRLALAS